MPNSPESSDPAPDNGAAAGTGNDQRKGVFIEGGEIQGSVIGYQENNTTYTEEQSYNVAGLPNPYLGLRAFTATERDIFAGRERMVQALVQRLAADDGDRLLFLVGASGSGKSSLARAGLLPALEARLSEQGLAVETRILERPGRTPAAALKRLLLTPPTTALLLLIDQFEELFSQAESEETRHVLDLLLELATQHDRFLRVIATMRSDFMPQLLADARFEPYERRKIVVRAMTEAELIDAIQRPVQVRYPDKRLEGALVTKLARDAAVDPAYLPLLQVTLEELWRGESLRLAAYSCLADAIQRRAETVYHYRDHDTLQQEPRSLAEQQALLDLLLDLVRVSPSDEQRETRWRRTRTELAHGDPQREQLIADLTTARLLRTDRETEQERIIETVEVVHEALLQGWPRLREAVEAKREWLRQRERFLLALHDWRDQQQQDDYLLRGIRLAEAEVLWQQRDSAFHEADALLFYEYSLQWRNQERQRQIRRTRLVVTALCVLTLLALIAAGIASWFNTKAQQRLRIAEARRLGAESTSLLAQFEASERALLLAIEGIHLDDNPTTRQALQLSVVARPYSVLVLSGHKGFSTWATFSPDDNHILTASSGDVAQLWDIEGRIIATLQDYPYSLVSPVFSPDSKHILNGSSDGRVQVWNISGELLVNVQGHTEEVNSAVFSPDSTRFLTASGDKTARLWNLEGKLLSTLQGHTETINSAGFSPDGKLILTASGDKTARLWDLEGKLLSTLQGHTETVNSAVFSPDGKLILTASGDKTARLWNLTSGNFIILQGHTKPLSNAIFSPDGKHILTTSPEGIARLWNIDGTNLTVLDSDTMNVRMAFFSPDGQNVLTAPYDGPVRLWNLKGQLITSFQGHKLTLLSAMFSSDGNRVLTAATDRTARLWSRDGKFVTGFQGHTDNITSAVFRPDGIHLLTSSNDGTTRLWGLDGTTLAIIGSNTFTVTRSVFSPDGQHILTASEGKVAQLLDLDGKILATFEGHMDDVTSAVFSADGKNILTTSDDRTARLWNMDGSPLAIFEGHGGSVTSALFSPDSKRILTTSWDNWAALWDQNGTPLTIFKGHTEGLTSAVFSPDGTHILTASRDGTARLWNLDGIPLATLQGHTDDVTSAVFSPDGTRILTASRDGTARLWNLDGIPLATLQGHTDDVTSAVFSPDGTHILTASWDGAARLWNLDGIPLTTFQGHTNFIQSAVFSPDGKRFLTTSADGTAQLWPVQLDDWLLAAKCRVSRTLTDEEIRDYQVPTPLHFDATAFAQRQCPPVYSWER